MSKYEPFCQEISIKRWVFWYFIPTQHVILSSDNDPVELVDWMEQNIGRCGKEWDWDWLLDYIPDNVAGYQLIIYYYIKIRKRRSHLISFLLLRFKA